VSLTAEGIQSKICVSLGNSEILRGNIAALWRSNSRYSARPRLQELATFRDAVVLCLGNLDEQLSQPVGGDLEKRLASRRTILLALLADINMQWKQVRRGQAVVGTLTATVLEEGLPGQADPNDPRYGGDPRYSPLWVQIP
jgi:hypothetical protein